MICSKIFHLKVLYWFYVAVQSFFRKEWTQKEETFPSSFDKCAQVQLKANLMVLGFVSKSKFNTWQFSYGHYIRNVLNSTSVSRPHYKNAFMQNEEGKKYRFCWLMDWDLHLRNFIGYVKSNWNLWVCLLLNSDC